MTVEHVELLVEEPSMEAALRLLLPKMLGDLSFEIYPHLCKDDLVARLGQRLRGYAAWLPEAWRIVVVVDRDDEDCRRLKAKLEKHAAAAGLVTRARAAGGRWMVVNRVVIEELEAWYFGDWGAVRTAYPRVPATIAAQARYRDPDAITGGTWEAFERILQKAGYFEGGLRKTEVARAVAPHMEPWRNQSVSFRALREALVEISGR